MITKFKIFEYQNVKNNYMLGNDQFFINDVIKYLGADVDTMIMDNKTELKSIYNVNVIDFFKEILLGKTIIFQSKDVTLNDPTIRGNVIDIDSFLYKDDFWIKVKLSDATNRYYKYIYDKDDYLIKNNSIVSIYDYDANTKPLHKKVELEKQAKKYNI